MTSQIAILNKYGVAIASDTLSTLESDSTAKSLQNSRKMFDLGPKHNVVVVNSDLSTINGVPISTLLAKWAESHEEPLNTLQEYAWSFLFWMEELSESQLPGTRAEFTDFITAQIQEISERVSSHFPAGDKPWWPRSAERLDNDKAYANSYTLHAAREVGKFHRAISDFDEEFYELLEGENREFMLKEIERIALLWFPENSLRGATRKKLLNSLWKSTFKKPIEGSNFCCLGFVGYGADDFYPRLESFNIERVVPGVTRYGHGGSQHSNFQNSAGMYRWAQFDAIDTFLKGIHSTFLSDLKYKFRNAAVEQKRVEFENPEEFTPAIELEWSGLGEAIYNRLEDYISSYQENHYENLLSTLSFMDTPELAQVAKSLIEMQVLAAHNSMNIQTVGGDIEVVTIAPRNGITWRNRLPS